jgi:drug/metabolite transporter (DMT)-like permease
VASYRLILGAGFVAVIAAAGRRGLDRISPDAVPPGAPLDAKRVSQASISRFNRFLPILAAGLVAALHFAFYIGALYRTTIAHALVLVNLSPLLAMPLAAVFLGERFDLRRLPGVLVVIAGLAIMVGLEPGLTRAQLSGDLMALLAALAYAVYSLIGRGQRTRTNLLAYTFWVYLVAGLALLPLAQWQRVMGRVSAAGTALPGLTILAVVLLALLPTAGGHTLYNAALRRADTVTVNLIATQEVTGGVLLGLLLLGEVPSARAIVGGIVALGGLGLVLARRQA